MTIGSSLHVSLILLPADEQSDRARRSTLDSIEAQDWSGWEVVEVRDRPERFEELRFALARASGDLIGFVTEGDRLSPDALSLATRALNHDDADVVYTDEDAPTGTAKTYAPFYKPDLSPDRLLAQNYIGRLVLFKRNLLDDIGGIRPESLGAWEHDLVLRATQAAARVAHVSEVAYHRSSPPIPPTEQATNEARQVIEAHLGQLGYPAAVEAIESTTTFRFHPRLHETPLVSIVIPTGGSKRRIFGREVDLVSYCVDSIIERSTYQSVEIVIVADASTPVSVLDHLVSVGGERLKIVEFHEPFNFSRKINLGAVHSSGDYLLLLNDDTAVITPDWIETMLMHAVDSGVGAVGAILRFDDRRYQHTGVLFLGGNPGHPYYGAPAEITGYHDNLLVTGNHLAVTAACLMTDRARFDEVGGFSPAFPSNYNDVDFCLKLHQAGYRNVRAAGVELYHFESSSRGVRPVKPEELALLHARWHSLIASDPFYSPHFQPTVDYLVPTREGDPTVGGLVVGSTI